MKRVFLVVLFLAFSGAAFAQTGTAVQVKFTPSVSPTAVSTDIWAGTGDCAAGIPADATVIGNVASPVSSLDWTLGTAGKKYCFFAKAKDAAGNSSVASNLASATFPFPALAPPTNLTATPK